jgi:hypothetical protein
MTYEGLKLLYMPFIAKLQILEKSHMGGIARTNLKHLDKEFELLTYIIDHKEANILEADFYSRVADVLYYKNSDLRCKFGKNRLGAEEEKNSEYNGNYKNNSCTACHYYHKALSKLLNKDCKDINKKKENTLMKLLQDCVKQLDDKYYNMKFCTVLARILSDWGNVFFSCDKKNENGENCYIGDKKIFNTRQHCYNCACYICDVENCETYYDGTILEKYFNYVEHEFTENNRQALLKAFESDNYFSKMEIAFAMYAISFQAFRKASLNKRAAYQIYKMLRLLKCYKIYNKIYIDSLSQKAISLLLSAADNLHIFEQTKRKKDLGKETIPLQYLLVDSDITMIWILVKELELKLELELDKTLEKLKKMYELHIASPYGIIHSIPARIFELRLKSYVNYEVYRLITKGPRKEREEAVEKIFGEFYPNDIKDKKMIILEKLVSESIFSLKEIIRLSKTLDETYLFNHSFMGLIHKNLSFWINRCEVYKKCSYKKNSDTLRIDKLLKRYLDYGWEEQLSSHYENEQALSHYYKCLETHREGKAYHVMIDNMHYVKDDFNDRSDHFSIALERHKILNGEIDKKIKELKRDYKDSVSF